MCTLSSRSPQGPACHPWAGQQDPCHPGVCWEGRCFRSVGLSSLGMAGTSHPSVSVSANSPLPWERAGAAGGGGGSSLIR